MRLQGALDNEVYVAVQRFLEHGISADVDKLYSAIQKSNSSLKRRPKKVLESSVERILEFMRVDAGEEDDVSEKELEKKQFSGLAEADSMNRSLRTKLTPSAPPLPEDETKKRRMPNGEPVSKRQKSALAPSNISLDDIGGMDDVIEKLGEQLILPLLKTERYQKAKLNLPRGILMHGPPGCGKTMITRAWAAELQVPFIEILGPSIVSGMSGESEKGIREKFEEAKKCAPCLIFIDEIDAIAPKRESSQSQMEKRIVAQLLVSMDELGRDYEKPVIVLAATNRPDSLDPALRRGGRFGTEINISVPNETVREQVLKAQTREQPVAENVDFHKLAKMTAGFVGADLQDLVDKASSWQLNHYRQALEEQAVAMQSTNDQMEIDTSDSQCSTAALSARRLIRRCLMKDVEEPPGFEEHIISMDAFLSVLPGITPSSKREGFATVPNVSWNDVGALKSVRDELRIAIVEPITHPEVYSAVGISAPTGVLLWGPPGCGKTLIAKAVAAESKANFISVKGPELLNKFVGESEAAVRRLFARARSSVPCVILFDELDALVPRRDEGGSEASARVVNTLLTELDGLDERKGIYIIGATNRPEMIDNAMLRPGRFETPLFVDLPGPEERVEVLTTLLNGISVDRSTENGDIAAVVRDRCKGYSGADLGALVREAGHNAIRRGSKILEYQDFWKAHFVIQSSVGDDIQRYNELKAKFRSR